MKPKVYLTRRLPDQIMELIDASCQIKLWPEDSYPPREELIRQLHDVEGIYTVMGAERIDAEIMDAAPSLKVISNNGVGCDHVDIAAATARGILVANAFGANKSAVADYTLGFMIAIARRIAEYDSMVRQGGWTTWPLMGMVGQEVSGQTLGIVGLGSVGSEVARRARAFDMTLLYYDVRRRPDLEKEHGLTYTDLDDLLRRSDFVTLHVGLTEATRHLISAERLALMKPTAYLINAARGGIVDQRALAEALKAGRIAGAAVDVTEKEPIPADDPLLSAPNCLITPHRAAASFQTRIAQAMMGARNLIRVVTGEAALSLVNPEVLERPNRRAGGA